MKGKDTNPKNSCVRLLGLWVNFSSSSNLAMNGRRVSDNTIASSVERYPQQRTSTLFFLLFIKNKFIYLFLAVLGLRFCTQAFSSCSKWGLLFILARGLLIVVASPVAEHRL